MRKINEQYQHEETGIQFEVQFASECPGDRTHEGDMCDHAIKKKVRIMPSQQSGWVRGEKGFVFSNSKPEMVVKIGKALLDIGEFAAKL